MKGKETEKEGGEEREVRESEEEKIKMTEKERKTKFFIKFPHGLLGFGSRAHRQSIRFWKYCAVT